MESDLKNLSSLRVNPLEEEDEEEEEEEVANDGFGKKVEQEEVDDDEEDEEEFEVTLGFVEKPKHSVVLLRHFFPSKAGGVPAWLDPVNLPSEIYFTCGFCKEPLQFLLQIYAPITDNDPTFHRMLYVFMCPSTSCLLRDQHEQWKRGEDNPCRSVKIFRCQLPRSNAFYSSAAPKRNGTDKPSTFGAPLCSWCGAWKGYKICASCKSAQYCSVNHQSMHWRSGHKNECCKILNSTEVSASTTIANGIAKARAAEKYASSSLWPEFEIIIEDECAFDLENSEDNSSFNSLAIKSDKTDETYQVLSDMFEADADKKAWASFQERIAKAPRQVIRYCRDVVAKPLWPLVSGRPSKADIPRCNYCKSPLTYEFQVMPQLLFYFGENDSDSLDWGTIVAYTCSASCDAGISYKEEFAWVQLHPAST